MQSRHHVLKEASGYCTGVIASVGILILVFRLWAADLHVPFIYIGDALFYNTLIKWVRDMGWFFANTFVGVPGTLDLYDFPFSDNLHLIQFRLFGFFTPSFGLVNNLFFLCSFPLITLSSLIVFRHFKIGWGPALVGGLLYAFAPYHITRSEIHVLLSGYYVLPLITMVILWVWDDQPLFFRYPAHMGGPRFSLDRKSIWSIVVALLIASTGIYYAFFACFFLLIAGVSSYLTRGNRVYLYSMLVLLGLIMGGGILNMSPNITGKLSAGSVKLAPHRQPQESELFGLKIVQLLLPVRDHQVNVLSDIRRVYDNTAPVVTENSFSSLGFVAGIGFVILLCEAIFRGPLPKKTVFQELRWRLSTLNLAAIALATVGGFSSLIAYYICPLMRAQNRISIYLAFFSMFAAVMLLENLSKRLENGRWWARTAFSCGLAGVLCLGIVDQTPKEILPDFSVIKCDYLNDARFVAEVEKSVPPGSKIFQLPYVRFPENVTLYKMADYDHFRAYLHSKHLRWSYGCMSGRYWDVWQRQVTAKPMPQMIEAIAAEGFAGIYLDRFGYDDDAVKIENEIRSVLKIEPVTSINNRYAFYSLGGYKPKKTGRMRVQDDRFRMSFEE